MSRHRGWNLELLCDQGPLRPVALSGGVSLPPPGEVSVRPTPARTEALVALASFVGCSKSNVRGPSHHRPWRPLSPRAKSLVEALVTRTGRLALKRRAA
jgi:hypothetical protein